MQWFPKLILLICATCLSVACSTNKKSEVAQSNPCEQLLSFNTDDANVKIKTAVIVPAGPVPPVMYQRPYAGNLSSYCRIDGVIDERIGEGGKPYGIGFAIAMPENWNGRFMMQGGGGLNGSVATPLGSNAAGDMTALQRGFAVVTTDTGHQGSHGFDASFF